MSRQPVGVFHGGREFQFRDSFPETFQDGLMTLVDDVAGLP